jgi:tRNA threonylcarbamoyladenosine biosynthesis protein TsaB
MLVLALDTTTRAGSLALMRDDTLLATESGDPLRTHGERLPADIIRLLGQHDVALSVIDLFAVGAGPGSFTGLRIGIATMQGLALANGKGLVGVSTLDALALAAARQIETDTSVAMDTIAVWMDAQRQEVFAALYAGNDLRSLDGPTVGSPEEVLDRWSSLLDQRPVWFVGDGAVVYRSVLDERSGKIAVIDPTPLTAPAIAILAARAAAGGQVPRPHDVRPVYVRRPDAELARDRIRARVEP